MPVGSVAPIKGMLRKRFFFDVTMSLGSGVTFALAFWYGVHIPRVQKRDTYYAKLEKESA